MTALQDDFGFRLVGPKETPFDGYISTDDPTNTAPNALVRGSLNVYKDLSQKIVNRCGLIRRGAGDPTEDPVKSTYEWYDSTGRTIPMRVLGSGKLQFETDIVTPGTFLWYDLYTDADHTRYSFAPWWDNANQKDLLTMVKGDTDILAWGGGFSGSVGSINTGNTILIVQGTGYDTSYVTIPDTGEATQTNRNDDNIAIVFNSNPVDGEDASLIMETGAPSSTLAIVFNTVLPADQVQTVHIKIGATKEDTAANLLDFLNDPTISNALHTKITDADTISAIGNQTYSSVDSLEAPGTEGWLELGFLNGENNNTETIVSSGVEYTYLIVVGRYLVDIAGGIPSGFTYQALVITEDQPTDGNGFTNDMSIVNGNQLIIGSYNSRVVYASLNTDYTDFNPVDTTAEADLIGYPFILTLDDTVKGFAIRQGNLQVAAGLGDWYEIVITAAQIPFTDQASLIQTITVNKKPAAALSAPLGQEFITNNGDDIFYLGQDHQVYIYGSFTDQFTNRFPVFSQAIRDELKNEDFTGGALRFISDSLYLTSITSGKTYIYQARQYVDGSGNIQAERLWFAPQLWNVARICVIDAVLYGASNQNPQYYQLFDTGIFHDETPTTDVAPYECKARWAYWHAKNRARLLDLDKVFIEGYIAQNSPLQASILFNYLGATDTQTNIISALDSNPYLYGDSGVVPIGSGVGDHTIGGEGLDEFGNPALPKFRTILTWEKKQVFEYQIELYSYDLDSQWQILAIGSDASEVITKSVELIKT